MRRGGLKKRPALRLGIGITKAFMSKFLAPIEAEPAC
jgi:hypothetical protein